MPEGERESQGQHPPCCLAWMAPRTAGREGEVADRGGGRGVGRQTDTARRTQSSGVWGEAGLDLKWQGGERQECSWTEVGRGVWAELKR